jgi:hypothetical protein
MLGRNINAERRALGIEAHDKVSIEIEGDAIVVRAVPDFFELEGFLDQGLPADEERERMAKGVAEHASGEQ